MDGQNHSVPGDNDIPCDPRSIIVQILDEIIPPRNQIRRVPLLLRDKLTRPGSYDPLVVSLGPYHHGRPDLHLAEVFKQKCLEVFIAEDGNGKDESFYYERILERIDEIRSWYEEVVYDDEVLAAMILRDACFLIFYLYAFIYESTQSPRWHTKYTAMACYFGPSKTGFIVSDVYVLENQIPLWVPKFLFRLQTEEGESVFNNLLCWYLFDAWAPNPHMFLDSPHFLDACHRKLVFLDTRHTSSKTHKIHSGANRTYRFQSITNLKAKGIHLKRSTPTEEAAVSFSSYTLYGELRFPELVIRSSTFVIYSNLIAYEMSPANVLRETYVSSYINFIKSLIENSNDVKVLRENEMLFNHIGGDNEVVKLFKDLDTFGCGNSKYLADIRYSMEKHCCKKSNTWITDLIQTYFKSPWKAIALVGAFALLSLTFLQTYYTIRQFKA